MDFSIKFEEFKENKKMFDDMANDLEPKGLVRWAETLEKTAKEICDDPDCKRINFKVKDSKLSYSFADSKAIDCMLKAIEQHYNSFSLGLQGYCEAMKETLKKQKQDMEKSSQ